MLKISWWTCKMEITEKGFHSEKKWKKFEGKAKKARKLQIFEL